MLTPAEVAYLRRLPERLGTAPAGKGPEQLAAIARRRRLQAAGLLTVQLQPVDGFFLVMLTEAGLRALAISELDAGR